MIKAFVACLLAMTHSHARVMPWSLPASLDSSTQLMWWSCCRAQELMLKAFTCGFNMPKFHVMKDFVRAVRQLGGTGDVSTEHGEGTHSQVKAAYPFSNRHPESMLHQVRWYINLSISLTVF